MACTPEDKSTDSALNTINVNSKTDSIIYTLEITPYVIQLSGEIDNQYPIKMTLSIAENEIHGYYFYEKYKTKIPLIGKIEDTVIFLSESPSDDDIDNISFKGELKGDSLKGQWTNNSDNKKMNFELKIIKKEIPYLSSIAGNYIAANNSNSSKRKLNIRNIDENNLLFDISVSNTNGCSGHLINIVEIENDSLVLYSGELCKELKFQYFDSTINVSENKCEWHGVRCSFTEKYIRQNERD